MELVWTELYRIGGEQKVIYIHFDSDVVGELNDIKENELGEIKNCAYQQAQANNEIREYFKSSPSESRFDLYIQKKDITLYLMKKRLDKAK